MKAKIRRYAHLLREGFAGVVRVHPVELLLALYGCVGCILTYELDWDDAPPKLTLAALFFIVTFVVNHLCGRGPWRKVYWVSWTPIVPLTLWPGLEEWLGTEPAFITFGILLPLALLLCRLAIRNERFVSDAMVYLRAGVLALLFANVALGLFSAILYSTAYIFGLEGRWIGDVAVYAVIICNAFGVPVLFLMMTDRWLGGACRGNRIVEVLLNYIVTPALMIYAAILYLYMGKILFTWTLPEGGVAYLVFGFTLFSLTVAAMQFLLDKRIYDGLFSRISLILLPTQILFWIGVVRRTNEYGLTEPRVYLLVCGGLMTLCVMLFLTRRMGRYFYVALTGLLCFAALAYVPSLEPERIAIRSQVRRAVRMAENLQVLDREGKLLPERFAVDSLSKRDYRRLYESLEYVGSRDSAAFARFGVAMDDVREAVPATFRGFVTEGYDYFISDEEYIWINPEHPRRTVLRGSYRTMYSDMNYARYGSEYPSYSFDNDSLRIDLTASDRFRIAGQDLLRRQLERAELGVSPHADSLRNAADRLLTYSDNERTILFSHLRVVRADSVLRLEDLSIDIVLTR